MKLQHISRFIAQCCWWGMYLFAGTGILVHWVAGASIATDSLPELGNSSLHLNHNQDVENRIAKKLSSTQPNTLIGENIAAYFYTNPDIYVGDITGMNSMAISEPVFSDDTKRLTADGDESKAMSWQGGVSLRFNSVAYQQNLRYLNPSETVLLQDDLYGPGKYQILTILLMSDAALNEWLAEQQQSSSKSKPRWLILHSPYEQEASEIRYVIMAHKLSDSVNLEQVSYRF
ncbi:hypothetical protein [Thalassotalea mangrovi]|uniref:Uncharacterized protein n=1 Tax=Thalassotalea mangrovi TaxID=2572245 RepID=A0A4U1BBH3_9GAMM|nr:hypothetical protein [Thalassotalea mangrovi]TKB47369.1 hypothetical protein E8M12_00845 [Thalassotalea mangrovi]